MTEDEIAKRQAQAEIELIRLQRAQQAEDWTREKAAERAKAGGVAPVMSV